MASLRKHLQTAHLFTDEDFTTAAEDNDSLFQTHAQQHAAAKVLRDSAARNPDEDWAARVLQTDENHRQ